MYDFHRFLDWSETTDDASCFLIPIDGVLYLTGEFWLNTCSSERSGIIYCAEVTPEQLTQTIKFAIDILKKKI